MRLGAGHAPQVSRAMAVYFLNVIARERESVVLWRYGGCHKFGVPTIATQRPLRVHQRRITLRVQHCNGATSRAVSRLEFKPQLARSMLLALPLRSLGRLGCVPRNQPYTSRYVPIRWPTSLFREPGGVALEQPMGEGGRACDISCWCILGLVMSYWDRSVCRILLVPRNAPILRAPHGVPSSHSHPGGLDRCRLLGEPRPPH